MPATNMQLSIRIKPQDYQVIKANADKANMSVSAWLIQRGKRRSAKRTSPNSGNKP